MRLRRLNPGIALLAMLVGGCGSPPQPQGQGGQIRLDTEGTQLPSSPDPDRAGAGPLGELRPCRTDAPAGCVSESGSGTGLSPDQHYEIPILSTDPIRGATSGGYVVSVVVFSDFQCPFCGQLEPVLAELLRRYPSELRVVWKDLPLPMHAFARPAAELLRSIQQQRGLSSFWEAHDFVFAHQAEFSDTLLKQVASRFSVDPSLDQEQSRARIAATVAQADALGIRSTPTTFINGRPIVGAKPLIVYMDTVDAELARAAAREVSGASEVGLEQ